MDFKHPERCQQQRTGLEGPPLKLLRALGQPHRLAPAPLEEEPAEAAIDSRDDDDGLSVTHDLEEAHIPVLIGRSDMEGRVPGLAKRGGRRRALCPSTLAR